MVSNTFLIFSFSGFTAAKRLSRSCILEKEVEISFRIHHVPRVSVPQITTRGLSYQAMESDAAYSQSAYWHYETTLIAAPGHHVSKEIQRIGILRRTCAMCHGFCFSVCV